MQSGLLLTNLNGANEAHVTRVQFAGIGQISCFIRWLMMPNKDALVRPFWILCAFSVQPAPILQEITRIKQKCEWNWALVGKMGKQFQNACSFCYWIINCGRSKWAKRKERARWHDYHPMSDSENGTQRYYRNNNRIPVPTNKPSALIWMANGTKRKMISHLNAMHTEDNQMAENMTERDRGMGIKRQQKYSAAATAATATNNCTDNGTCCDG